jgi:hypothetical protein
MVGGQKTPAVREHPGARPPPVKGVSDMPESMDDQKTYVADRCVSTVRLTIDHGFDGVPKWYETMVFPAKDGKITGRDELFCERYTTEEEAAAGHQAVVEMIEAESLPEYDE